MGGRLGVPESWSASNFLIVGQGKQLPVAAGTLPFLRCHHTQTGRPLAPPAMCPVEAGCHHKPWNGAAGRMPQAHRLSLLFFPEVGTPGLHHRPRSSLSLSQCPIDWDGRRKSKTSAPCRKSRLRGEGTRAYSGPQSIQGREH